LKHKEGKALKGKTRKRLENLNKRSEVYAGAENDIKNKTSKLLTRSLKNM
jgi:hypothetical protein